MSRDEDSKVTRRGALRALFGGEIRDRMRTTGLVEDYRAVLRTVALELPFGVPVERLPASPEEIGDAIVRAASGSWMDLPRSILRDAYASLALFADAGVVAVLQGGRADLERQDFGDEAQERIRIAFERRSELLRERARREHEFDERVPLPKSRPGEGGSDAG